MNPMVQAMAATLIRWVLTTLAAQGYTASESTVSQAVYGALAVFSLLWGLWHKKRTDEKIKEAQAGV